MRGEHPYYPPVPTPRTHAPRFDAVHTNHGQDVTTEDFQEPLRLSSSTIRHRPLTERDRRAIQKQHPRSIIKYEGERTYSQLPANVRERIDPSYQTQPVRRKRRIHPLTYVGVAAVLMLLGWIGVTKLVSWGATTLDDLKYGRPRTFQCDAVVGHGDSADHPSHFIAINYHRQVHIIELPGGDASHAKSYSGLTLIGDDQDLTPITISFANVNSDHKLDMVVAVGSNLFVFINDNGSFRPLKPGEQIHLP